MSQINPFSLYRVTDSDSDTESDDIYMSAIEILDQDTNPESRASNLRKINALHELGIETKLWTIHDKPIDVYFDVIRCYSLYKKQEEIRQLSEKLKELNELVKEGFTGSEIIEIVNRTYENFKQLLESLIRYKQIS